MYESRETSIRGIVVTILLIILVICVLIWIFPTKKDIKGISGGNNEVLLSEFFGHNLRVLQNAGRAYYYSATLPKNNGDSVSITLGELVGKKMLLELKDKKGKTCDNDKSYVQLTKTNDSDYEMKSYLSCGDESDYIVTTLGCNDFKGKCSTPDKNVTPTPTPDKGSDEKEEPINPDKTNYYYRYLYSCPKTSTSYSSWSNWSTNYVSNSSTRVVETKVEYENKYVKVGTKQEPVTTYQTVSTTQNVEETVRYVNTKPSSATNCITLPRTGYTLYECKVSNPKTVTQEVPVTTYNTVDVYDWQTTAVTYYRYKTLKSNTTTYTEWSTKYNDDAHMSKGCTIIKSEKVAK